MSKETKIFVLEEMQISLDFFIGRKKKEERTKVGFFFFNLFRKFLRSCARICLAVKIFMFFIL